MLSAMSLIDVAPRGSRSSAAVMSLASTEVSSWKCLMMRCQSLSAFCTICATQCSSSTKGLPRSLQKTVAPSTAL